MPVRGVIFDVDGTLVDSNNAHARAWVAAFEEFGYHVPFEKVRPLIGMGGDKLLPAAAGVEKDTAAGKRLSERRTELFKMREAPSLRPFPGAHALVQRLKEAGLRLVVATSAQPDEVKALLRVVGVEGLFEELASSGDAERSKPDPDIVQAALHRAKLVPTATVMVGDTPYDIESAAKAGVPVIALRCGGWSDDDLRGAVAIYDDPADLLAHLDESRICSSPSTSTARR